MKQTAPKLLPIVLVVDDEPPIRAVARRMLESGGYRVFEASNGAEALLRLEGDAPVDLVLGSHGIRTMLMTTTDIRRIAGRASPGGGVR